MKEERKKDIAVVLHEEGISLGPATFSSPSMNFNKEGRQFVG